MDIRERFRSSMRTRNITFLDPAQNIDVFVFLEFFPERNLSFVFLFPTIRLNVCSLQFSEKPTRSNSDSPSSYETFSSASSNPPANAPHRSGEGLCQMRIVPWLVVEARRGAEGCHCATNRVNKGGIVKSGRATYMDIYQRFSPTI
jgi:hypothetical protein